MATTISLLNMKGGVGKTTLAVNLSWHFFANENKNVLLVDLDPQFNATQYVMDFSDFDPHRKTKGTIADLLLDPAKLDLRRRKLKKDPKAALYNVRNSATAKFDLLPSELDLGWVVKNPAQMDFRLEKVLISMQDDYDYIFIDCAPTDSVLTTMALTASDYILVPVRPDRFSVLGFSNLAKTIEAFRQNCNDPHQVKTLGVVFTQVMGTSTVETESMAQVRVQARKLKEYVFSETLKHSNSFARAVKNQTPVFEAPYARKDVKRLSSSIASEMTSRIEALPTQ
jgi:chromosome partitioning protein